MGCDEAPVIGIAGVRGRLGTAFAAACAAGGIHVLDVLGHNSGRRADVVVDASGPGAAQGIVDYCQQNASALVYCVSGAGLADRRAIEGLSTAVPVVVAVNLTVGHYLQRMLLQLLARETGRRCAPTAAVIDRHPVTKRDAPSGTSISLASLWDDEFGDGSAEIQSVRDGNPVSDHIVRVSLGGEEIAIGHAVTSLAAAASGALLAAEWASAAAPGLYGMNDVYLTTKKKAEKYV